MGSLFFYPKQIWNHTRSLIFVHKSQNKQIVYVCVSLQNQFVAETCIIMVLNAVLVFSIILTKAARRKNRWN